MGRLVLATAALIAAVPALGGGAMVMSGVTTAQAPKPAVHRTAVLAPMPTYLPGARTTAPAATSLRTWDLAGRNRAYKSQYAAAFSVPTGFTGSESSCNAGSISSTSRAATLRAINYVRSLSGLAPVSFGSTLNARAQQTALLMSANQSLNHYPPSYWRCWNSTAAANAARSNLALAYPTINSGSLVRLYMNDPGSTNTFVGHRRWLLNPWSTVMGTGATNTANAITVIGPSSYSRANPAWVSWPTPGYFPKPLAPAGRWSLSAGDVRTQFGLAHVRVYKLSATGHFYRIWRVHRYAVHNGYAQPTLVWQMPAGSNSGVYRVVVTNIHKSGFARTFTRAYRVHFFTPS